MAAIVDGDRGAFDQLYRKYQGRLLIWLSRMESKIKIQDAENLAQETWCKVFRHASLYRPKNSKFSSWLIKIAQNCVIDFRRSRENAQQASYNEITERYMAATGDSIDRTMIDEEARLIEPFIQLLPEKQRTAFIMFVYCGMNYEEIAVAMEVPRRTAQSRFNWARINLQKMMGILSPAENSGVSQAGARIHEGQPVVPDASA